MRQCRTGPQRTFESRVRQETPDFNSLDLWPSINPHLKTVDSGLHAGAYKKLVRDMVQKQRLVEVRTDFEQTVVNKAIDEPVEQATRCLCQNCIDVSHCVDR